MNKKMMLLIGLVMSLTAGSAVAMLQEVPATEILEWDDVRWDNDANESSSFGSENSFSWDDYSEEETVLDSESSTKIKQAGFLKRAQKRVRNFVYPQSTKKYRDFQYLGHVACGTNWALILGGLASAGALKKALSTATAQITEENKKADKKMSSFQVRKAAFARAWKNFRATKLINQKALLGSGALLATGICAKLFLLWRMREPKYATFDSSHHSYTYDTPFFERDPYSRDQ